MNTPTNPTDSDLNIRLAHEADAFFSRGGTVLDIGQVLDRAGEIKRGRRMRATMLMAACVLAVAVPTALVVTRSDHNTPVMPSHHTKVDSSPLTLKGLERGPEPHDGYALDGKFHVGNGVIGLHAGRDTVTDVARFAGGVLVATRNDNGEHTAHVVDAQGATTSADWPLEGALAVSADGKAAAFVGPDGKPMVNLEGGAKTVVLSRIPRGSGFSAVAFTGDCSHFPLNSSCSVWVTSTGQTPETWQTWFDHPAQRTGREFDGVTDVVDGALVAGISERHEDLTTCSAVERFGQTTPAWSTCDHQLSAFSPDGSRVLAQPDGDGLGPIGLAVYGADDGQLLLDLDVADQGYIQQMVWEDNRHVLANVYQDGQWAVVRIGLDGSREYAVPPLPATDDAESPFVLPSS
jgi:hypothetical protein